MSPLGGCRVSDDHLLARVSSLLGVQLQALSRALTHVSRVYGEGAEVQPLNAAQADLARHALARGLYSRLADWFVNMLNVQLTFARLVLYVIPPPPFAWKNDSVHTFHLNLPRLLSIYADATAT